jgi:hypothetical protein
MALQKLSFVRKIAQMVSLILIDIVVKMEVNSDSSSELVIRTPRIGRELDIWLIQITLR